MNKKGIFLEKININACFANITEVWWQQNDMCFIQLLKCAQLTLQSAQTTIMQLAADLGDAKPSVRIRG